MKRVFIMSLCLMTAVLSHAGNIKVYVAEYKDAKDCAVSFTFDDGFKDHYTVAAPELEKRGWRGTFWVNGARVPGEKEAMKNRMSWDDIREMDSRGHEMSNHGWSHKRLTRCSAEVVREEIERNDSAMTANLGKKPLTFCYPYNAKNKDVISMASAGRIATRLFQFPLGCQSPDREIYRRMDRTLENHGWAIWMTHAVTEGYDYFRKFDRYLAFLDYIKKHEARIWVGTFGEVAAYVTERDAIKLEQEPRPEGVVVTPVLDLDPSVFDVSLTMVVDVDENVSAIQDGMELNIISSGGKSSFNFNPYGGKIHITVR